MGLAGCTSSKVRTPYRSQLIYVFSALGVIPFIPRLFFVLYFFILFFERDFSAERKERAPLMGAGEGQWKNYQDEEKFHLKLNGSEPSAGKYRIKHF